MFDLKMPLSDAIATSVIGITTVIVILAVIAVLIILVSKVIRAFEAKTAKAPAEAPEAVAAPAGVPMPAGMNRGQLELIDTDEKTAAVIMAIVSNKSGIPLNRLSFKSIKLLEDEKK